MTIPNQATPSQSDTEEVPDFRVGVVQCEHFPRIVLQHGDTRWFFDVVNAVDLGAQLLGAVSSATGTDVREIVDALLGQLAPPAQLQEA